MKRSPLLPLAVMAVFLASPLWGADGPLQGGGYAVLGFTGACGGSGAMEGGAWSSFPGTVSPWYGSTQMTGGGYTVESGVVPAIVLANPAATDISVAYAYPVPFKPSEGHVDITFKNLAQQTTIKIYTISGALVRTLEKNDSTDRIEWDARNERGENAVSGVYIYLITTPGQSKRGKLMIIR